VRITLQWRQLRKKVRDWENNIKIYLRGGKKRVKKTRSEFNCFTMGVRQEVLALFVTLCIFLCSGLVKDYQYKIWLYYVLNASKILDSQGTETAQCRRNTGFKIFVFLTEIWLNLHPFNLWYIKNHSNNVHYCDELITYHKVVLDGCKLIPTSVLLFTHSRSVARVKVRMHETWCFTNGDLLFPWRLACSSSLSEKSRFYFLPSSLPSLLTPWSSVLLEKLSSSQLVKKFPAFYGTPEFITAFTSDRYLFLSWARSVQSMPTHPASLYPSIYASVFQVVSLAQVSPPKPCIHLSPIRATCSDHFILLQLITKIILSEEKRSLSSSLGTMGPKYCNTGYVIRPSDLQDSSQMHGHGNGS
jgi:hypothetical protein